MNAAVKDMLNQRPAVRFSNASIQYIRCWWGQIKVADMARHLRCDEADLLAEAGRLGLPPPKSNPTVKQSYVMPRISRTVRKPHLLSDRAPAIRQELAKLPRPIKNGRGPVWTEEEDAKLEELVNGGFTYKECAQELGRTESATSSRGIALGFRPVARNNPIIRAMHKARYYLLRNDHMTALHVLEAAIFNEKGE